MPPKLPRFPAGLVVFLAGLLAAEARADLKTEVVYGEVAGETLRLDAFTPESDGPFPACLLVHGGGWVQGDKHKNFRTLLGPLGEAGFAWFSITYRLAPKHRHPAAVEVIRDASPSTHISAGLPPFLLVHGTEDTLVSVDQSRQFQSKLQAVGNRCDLLLVPGAGHGMVSWEKGDTTYKARLIEWLRQALR